MTLDLDNIDENLVIILNGQKLTFNNVEAERVIFGEKPRDVSIKFNMDLMDIENITTADDTSLGEYF